MRLYSVEEISNILDGELIGSVVNKIEGPEQLDKAKENHITFIGNSKYGNEETLPTNRRRKIVK